MVLGTKKQGSKSPRYRTACDRIFLQANHGAVCNQMHSDKLAMGALETPQQLDSMIVKGHGIRTKFGTISKGQCWLHGTFAFILEAVYRIGNRCELRVRLFRKVGIQESLIPHLPGEGC